MASTLKCMGTPPSFSAMFSKGDNFFYFLFAYLEDKVFPKMGLLLKERLVRRCSPEGGTCKEQNRIDSGRVLPTTYQL